MSIQYLSNEHGQITAVQLPIDEWEKIKRIFPEVDRVDFSLPEWHVSTLEDRLSKAEQDPTRIKPISELFTELDQ